MSTKRKPRLKVYGLSLGTERKIVAARSLKEAAAKMSAAGFGVSRYSMNVYGCETGNAQEIEKAIKNPNSVWVNHGQSGGVPMFSERPIDQKKLDAQQESAGKKPLWCVVCGSRVIGRHGMGCAVAVARDRELRQGYPDLPPGYRMRLAGERTAAGDLGLLNGQWQELSAGHVVNQLLVIDDRIATKAPPGGHWPHSTKRVQEWADAHNLLGSPRELRMAFETARDWRPDREQGSRKD